MKLLITGGCGFLGSNLAKHGIAQGFDVTVFDNLSRYGARFNFQQLQKIGEIKFIYGDIRNKNDVETLIKDNHFDAIFHLAAQTAMTTSIADPYLDFESNALGTINLLDSVRKYSKDTAILNSSTNKVYGDLEQYSYEETATRYICKDFPNGFSEDVPLNFHSPYGCSKGCADQYMLDFARIFGLKTVVFRHSSMYGSHQFATYDQGWIGWFCQKAIEKKNNPKAKPFTISGNGKQVRDILHAEDVASLYFSTLKNINTVKGDIFNIGGTMQQSLSLLELFELLNSLLDIKLEHTQIAPRESDQRIFVADIGKIKSRTQWQPKVTAKEGISKMISWLKEQDNI